MSTTASKGNRIAILAKLNSAQKSCRLMKQKCEALERKRRSLAEQICILKDSMNDMMGEAYFSLAEAKFICGDFSSFVLYSASQACCTVQMSTENMYGIFLRTCTLIERDDDDQFKRIGLSWSSSHLKKVTTNFREVLRLLIKVISMQMSFKAVDEGMKRTISAMNALECVIIPNTEAMLAKIVIELDEMEREEFYRLKKVQKMKQVAETRKREDRMSTYQILSEIRTSSILSVSASYSESFWVKKRESSYNILTNIPKSRFKKLLQKYSEAKDEIDERSEFEEKDESEEEDDDGDEEANIEEEDESEEQGDEEANIEEEDESEEQSDEEANIEEEDEGTEEEKGDEGADIEEKVEKGMQDYEKKGRMKDYEEETKDGEEDDEFDMDRFSTRDRLSMQTENNNLSLDSSIEISKILPSYEKISFRSYVPQTSSRNQLFADTESPSSSQYNERTLRSDILELFEGGSSSEDEYEFESLSADSEITRTTAVPLEQTPLKVDKKSVKGAKDYVPEIADIIPKIKLVSPVGAQPARIAIVKNVSRLSPHEEERSITSDLIQDSEVFVCKTELTSAATLIPQDDQKSGAVDNLRKHVIAEEYLVEDDYSGKVSDGTQERAFHEEVGVDTSEVYRKKAASPPVLFDLIRSTILGESESPSDSPQQRVEEVHPPLAEIHAHKQDLNLPVPEESIITIDLIQTIITEETGKERLGETSHPTAIFVPPKERSDSVPEDLITYRVRESSVTSETCSFDELSDILKYDEMALENSGQELLKTSEYTPIEIEEKISTEYRCPVLGTREKSVPTPSEPEEKPPSLWDTLFSNQHDK